MTTQTLQFIVASDSELDNHISIFLQAKKVRSPKTLESYRSILYLFRDYTGTDTGPILPEHIDAFLAVCKERKLSDTTIYSYFHTLKCFFTWLFARGKIESNPIDFAEKPPKPNLLPRAAKQKDLEKFFAYLEAVADKGRGHWLDVRNLAIWSLALDSGLRINELMALKVSDLTLEKNRRSAFVKGRKTYTDRQIFFSKATAKNLKRWRAKREELPLSKDTDALFVCYDKGKWRAFTAWGARQALTRICAKLGLPHIRPHDFRHTYAVYSLRKRADLLDIQRQLGHTSVNTTSKYLRVDDDGRRERYDKTSPMSSVLGDS